MTEILPANLVVFDVSSAEKIPSAEQGWERNLKKVFYVLLASLMYTKDLVLEDEDFIHFLLSKESFAPCFPVRYDPGEQVTDNYRIFSFSTQLVTKDYNEYPQGGYSYLENLGSKVDLMANNEISDLSDSCQNHTTDFP